MKSVRSLRVEKTVLEWGTWADGRMPANAFPLSKGKSYRLAAGWRWCVHKLSDGARQFRLLVAYDPAKQQFQSWLGIEKGSDQLRVARIKFHDSHGGWHCHWKTGDLKDIVPGTVRAGLKDRSRECSGERRDISDMDANGIAFRVFNVSYRYPIAGAML